jgi:hypothetical protein
MGLKDLKVSVNINFKNKIVKPINGVIVKVAIIAGKSEKLSFKKGAFGNIEIFTYVKKKDIVDKIAVFIKIFTFIFFIQAPKFKIFWKIIL